MFNLSKFIGPVNTPKMKVEVIDTNGKVTKTFQAPEGFQLERYVDALYPNLQFMAYQNRAEVNVSVIVEDNIVEIYRGTFK
jgi:hypothetical protein